MIKEKIMNNRKTIFFIFLIIWVPYSCASMVGDRNSTPAYVRIPHVYRNYYNDLNYIQTQQAPTRAAIPNAQMIVKPELQGSYYDQQSQTNRSPYDRTQEIGNYTHMYGTSNTYGGFDIK